MKKISIPGLFGPTVLACVLLMVSACAGNKPYTIELMPSPDVYDDGAIDPFTDTGSVNVLPYNRILYATDRLPAGESDKSLFYRNERGGVLRLGIARVKIARANITWEEARRISPAKNRSEKYPIRVSGVDEFGVLDRSATPQIAPDQLGADPHAAARAFADAINNKLENSKRKDIYVYTHGYKVIFEKDKALSLSRFLTRRERLGEMWAQDRNSAVAEYLYQNEADVSIINVTEASQATAGNGHGYFRRSPWASSDILITLAYGLSPTERGLVRGENAPIWAFPADYIERLRAAIIKANPDLKQALEEN